MANGRRTWRFSTCLLLGLLLLATTLQSVQGEEEEAPSQCKPYIEKALKEQQREDVPLDQGDSDIEPPADDSEHDAEADADAGDTANAESTETQQDDAAEEPTTADQAIVEETEGTSIEEQAEEPIEIQDEIEKETETEEAAGSTEEGHRVRRSLDEEAQSVEGEEEATETEGEATDATEEATETEEAAASTEADEPAAESQEATTEGTEGEPEGSEEPATEETEKEGSQEAGEEGTEGSIEKETAEGSQEAEQEAASVEEGEEAKETETATEEAQSTEAEAEGEAQQSAEAAESVEAQQSAETVEAQQSAETTESIEAEGDAQASQEGEGDQASVEGAESVETETEGKSAEGDEQETAEEKSIEEAEGEQADKKSAEAAESEQADEKSVEAEGETQSVEAEETKEDAASQEAEEVKEGEETKEEAASVETETKEGEEAEAKEGDEAEVKEGEETETKEEEGEEAETKEEEAAESKESAPEEELMLEIEIPDHLRPRDQIDQLLKLDDSNNEADVVVNKINDVTLKELKRTYESAIKPLETLYKYRDLSNRHFGDSEIFSKPLVVFMGPWSGGKSSIVNYLLNNEYNVTSLRTGAEPSPAYFNLVMYGDEPEVLDGTQLAADFTFAGLQKFGQGLEERLRGLKLPNKLLEKINIVEIPGILEVRKQVSRVFPFNDACQWFIDRADIIFLVYDPSKLDVGPETEAILDQLKGREHQTRIILNKADQVKPEELMRVQSALIWNISPLMSSAQPPVMYTTSLWSRPYEQWAPVRLLQAQERAFLRDLRTAVDKRIENKISSARRFAVRVRNHAKMVDCYLTTYYNHKSVFGNRKQVADQIIEHPQDYHIYEGLSTLTNISRYDLPDPDVYRDFFRLNPLYDFQQLSATCTYFRGCPINRLDVAIAYDLPELVGKHKKLVDNALAKIKPDNS